MNNLVEVLFQRDKVKWFEELLIEEPSDAQLDYVDDVFAQYMGLIQSGEVSKKVLVKLCKSILKVAFIRLPNSPNLCHLY